MLPNGCLETFARNFQIFIIGIFFLAKNCVSDSCHIHTTSGVVHGHNFKNGDFSMLTFKNIPFAKQPVADLRFELPEEADSFHSPTTVQPPGAIYCPQSSSNYVQKLLHKTFGQEDCLFLDIHIRRTNQSESLPVLIYFHPGRFSYGSKEEYGSGHLLDFNEMIIVIPNYRLGVLGFLSNQDASLPGNLGLWDQRMAMKWVYENIQTFGGDLQRITIAGHDAGGASVGLHILSHLSHRFFTAAISGSGTALDPWVLARNPAEGTDIVATALKCESNSESDLKACLKKRKLDDILEVQFDLKNEMFRPTVDEAATVPFLYFLPKTLYEKGYQSNASYIAGVTENEAIVEVNDGFPTAIKTQHVDKIIEHLLSPYLKETLNFDLVVKAAKYHYLRGVPVPSFESLKPQMIKMMSDFLYNSPLYMALKLHSQKALNTYMYVFNSKNSKPGFRNRDNPTEMAHINDAVYLLSTSFNEGENSQSRSKTNHFTEFFCKMWGTFIRTKSVLDINWRTFSEKKENYLEISETIERKVNYRKNNIELWTLLLPDLQKLQSVSAGNLKNTLSETKDATTWGIAGLTILLVVFCISMVGVVLVTRGKKPRSLSSIIPITSHKDDIQYSSIG